jgi:hypothetical protein
MSFSDEQMVNFYVNLMQSLSFPCDLVWKVFIWWMIMWVVNLILAVIMWPALRGRVRIQWDVRRQFLEDELDDFIAVLNLESIFQYFE